MSNGTEVQASIQVSGASRDRLQKTLRHEQPDRIPIDFGGSAVTGVHASCVAALRDYYGLEKRPVRVHEPFQMLALIDEDLRAAMGVDVIGVFARSTMFGFPIERWKSWSFNGLEVLVPGDFNTITDEKGDTLIYPEGDRSVPPSGRMPQGGYFFDSIIRQEPFDEEELNPEDNTEEFQPILQADLDHLARTARDAAATGAGVLAGFGGTAFGDIALVPGPFLKHPKGIRDVTEWYVSTRSRQDYIHKIFAHQCEIAIGNLQQIYAAAGDLVQAVFVCGTDFGTQTSAFCSVKTLDELYAPYYKQVNDWIHAHTPWKTFKHSCGAVSKFIPSLIAAGFDILNPVQCSAVGMEPAELKRKYGDRLVFWGGGVDTQSTLPFGTPRQVADEVTAAYLDGRTEKKWDAVHSDPDASYSRQIEVDFDRLEPLVAKPHNPENVVPVSEVVGTPIHQVVVGNCSNGTMTDLRQAAQMVRGKHVHERTRMIVVPATQKIYREAIAEGLIDILVEAGAAISPPTCGPCFGGHTGALAPGENSLATTNRNFKGRAGSPEASVYLGNAFVAAATAVAGEIVNPAQVTS